MRNHALAVLGCIALGCAGSSDEWVEPIGSTGQSLVFPPAGATQPGIKPDTEATCWQVSPNQNCVIPRKKAIRFYIYADSLATRSHIRSEMLSWYNSMVNVGLDQSINGWLWSETTNINDAHLTLVVDANPGAGFCDAPSERTRGLSCFTGSTTGVQVSGGLSGTYHTWQNGTVPVLHVDYGEIMGRSLTSAQKSNLVHQAVWSGLTRFGGIGLAVTGDSRCNTIDEQKDLSCVVRPQQACFFNGFGDTGNTSQVWIGGAACGT